MKNVRSLSAFCVAVAALTAAGCGDEPTAALAALYNDSTVTVDVATNAGDAAATSLEAMQANEGAASVSPGGLAEGGAAAGDVPNNNIAYTRTTVCFDAAGATVANCTPIASVRKIATLLTANGSRTGSNTTAGGNAATWTGAVHFVANDTLTRNFTAGTTTEVSRTHNNVAVGHDTTTFTDNTLGRKTAETTRDSVKGITWNLPRTSNPWPVSGSFVRADSVTVTLTKGTQTESKTVALKVQIDFPADAQGNVVLKVNSKVCNLNLVTHVVSACHAG